MICKVKALLYSVSNIEISSKNVQLFFNVKIVLSLYQGTFHSTKDISAALDFFIVYSLHFTYIIHMFKNILKVMLLFNVSSSSINIRSTSEGRAIKIDMAL